MTRILITGSREWTDLKSIETALLKATRQAHHKREPIIIVHGACPTGADEIAERLATFHGWRSEPYPALWDTDGYPQAGPMRNQRMVDLGADVCLAFPLGASRGTRDCMRRAEAAGIPVINCAEITP